MRRRGRSTELAELRARWRRWAAIVELFARRRRRCRQVDPRAYETIHRELIASCRSLAATDNGPGRVVYRSLEDLARPWLTLSTLAKADREILLDLLIRCRMAERGMRARV